MELSNPRKREPSGREPRPAMAAVSRLRAKAIRKAKTTNYCAADQKPGGGLYTGDLADEE